jgi:hypothetical protein
MYTELYFEWDDPEIAQYQAEMAKAEAGQPFDMATLKQWVSHPVAVDCPDEMDDDFVWMVLVKDDEYNFRKANGKLDKTFKKLANKFKRADGGPLMVFGPKGKTQHAPEERDAQGEDE